MTRYHLIACIVLGLVASATVAIFWDGGLMEEESIFFLKNYVKERPLLEKVFDPNINDFRTYQARELSYYFDYLDALFYLSIVAWVAPTFFIPAHSLVVPALLAGVFAYGVRRTARNLDGTTALLVLAGYFSCFVFIATMGLYYRSAKPILILPILAYLFHVRRVHQSRSSDPSPSQRRLTLDATVAFALVLVAGLLDRQGFFYALIACALLLLQYVLKKQLAEIFIATGAAVIALQVYNRLLGPWIIFKLNGYWPSFDYQNINLHEAPVYLKPAVHQVATNVFAMLGGSFPVAGLGLAAFCLLLLRARRAAHSPVVRRGQLWRAAFGPFLFPSLIFLAHVAMFALMITRYPPVYYWPDHRYWYYPLPLLTILLFAITIGLNAVWPQLGHGARRLVRVLLALLVVGNLSSLPHYRELMISGPWIGRVYEQNNYLKTFLRTGTGIENPKVVPTFHGFATEIKESYSSRVEPAR